MIGVTGDTTTLVLGLTPTAHRDYCQATRYAIKLNTRQSATEQNAHVHSAAIAGRLLSDQQQATPASLFA
jgi:hypothetical protein